MYFRIDGEFADSDLSFLQDLFSLFDARFDDLQKRIDASFDPDQMG